MNTRIEGPPQGQTYPQVRDLRLATIGATLWAIAALHMRGHIPPSLTRMALSLAILAAGSLALWSLFRLHERGQRHLTPASSARLTAALLLVAAALITLRCHSALTQYATHPLHVMIHNNTQARCHLTINNHPRPNTYGQYNALVTAHSCQTPTHHISHNIQLIANGALVANYQRSDNVVVTGTLHPLHNIKAPIAGKITVRYQHEHHSPHGITQHAQTLRNNLHNALHHQAHAIQSLAPAIALGDKTRMDTQDEEAFRAAGLSHLIVVSGFHTSIIISATALLIPGRGLLSAGISALIVALIVSLIGPTPSVLRACVMSGTMILAKLWGKGGQTGAALGIATSIMILWNPWNAINTGFALSVAATAGVIWPAQASIQRFRTRFAPHNFRNKILLALWQTATISWWAQLSVLPILALSEMPIALAAIPANLAIAPIITLLCCGTILLTLSATYLPALTPILILPCQAMAQWVTNIAQLCAQYAGQWYATPTQALAITAAVITVTYWRQRPYTKMQPTCHTNEGKKSTLTALAGKYREEGRGTKTHPSCPHPSGTSTHHLD